jgi:hypothetical protein
MGASSALAGEVTGPPGTANVPFSGSGVPTGAPVHANSACAFSGLNDMNPAQGPIDFHVQSPGQGVRNGAPPAFPDTGESRGSRSDAAAAATRTTRPAAYGPVKSPRSA